MEVMENKSIDSRMRGYETPEMERSIPAFDSADFTRVMEKIPAGMANAVKVKTLAKKNGITERQLAEILAIARSRGRAIVEKNGLVWEARSEQDIESIFESEKGQIIYR